MYVDLKLWLLVLNFYMLQVYLIIKKASQMKHEIHSEWEWEKKTKWKKHEKAF